VRGYGLSMELNPSPGLHLAIQSDLSHKWRGGTEQAEGGLCLSHKERGEPSVRKPALRLEPMPQDMFSTKSYFPVSNEHSAPPPAFCRISLGSTVQLSFEKLSMFDPAAPSGDTPAVAAVA
jgi:hypothetical protein